ncbi:MAG: DEAD/DEAH box helicase [Dehalococcoidia bacterium]|nr:DEAD/DEAH box helicase [Dehalococcoidia bacterium]
MLQQFHPVVRTWFERRFGAPTDAQVSGWPSIIAGRDTLISAPTGSGKTLAAFLAGIDALVRRSEAGDLPPGTAIVYVSPLKALSNDIQRNLEVPLAEIREVAAELGYDLPDIRVGLRTGDSTASERQAIVRKPPHILVTTPESLYLMVTAERSRATLRGVQTVIVDEIHALARDRRGSHLALTLARLDHVAESRPARIGLSATQRPIEQIAAFLVGADRTNDDGTPGCTIVDLGHQRDLELAVDVPPSDLEAVMPGEQWGDVYDRLAELVAAHRTTLIFVNTRKLSERVAFHLAQRLGEEQVASHHGSLSKERRFRVEQRLKEGSLKALVATASLELGIDIGSIDLVCQVGSPRSIAAFLQRVGRSGHGLGLRPHGRLFPTTRDELVETAALVRAVRAGRLDRIHPLDAPLDVLAQQIVAECACEDWDVDALYALARCAAPYRSLGRAAFDEIVEMMAGGVGDGAGRSPALLHHDRINGVLRARRGARMTAITNGGTIPEMGDYRVVADPDETTVGTVNEDFAIESMIGDIFLLGSTSWRIRRVESGIVRVVDAAGAPPTIPFWLGEAPGRTIELSEEVSRLRRDIVDGLHEHDALVARLREECGLMDLGAIQLIDYLRAARDGLGIIPTQEDIVFERFFDETGGMQMVVHAPYGARINRAWGLALRKRFCVTFDFELQAAASDDSILLSLGPQHSFPVEEAWSFVRARNVEAALEQAVLATPLFPTRWRWNATRALAVPRQRGGRRVPPFLQRMRSDDLLASVFPAQAACQDNAAAGPVDIPDHPLVRQAMRDCLEEAMDLRGLQSVLERIEAGEIRLHARETTEPSPMAHEILTGRPYTYLDDAPLEERRTRAVSLRRTLPQDARDLGALDAEAIARVRDEAWPTARDVEELHDALLALVAVRGTDLAPYREWMEALVLAGRAARLRTDHGVLWFAAENVNVVRLLYPSAGIEPALNLPDGVAIRVADRDEARLLLLRGHTEAGGPLTVGELALRTALTEEDAARGVAMLEAAGFVLRGRFTAGIGEDEYCDRRLLARIHRYTLDRLRREIDPVSAQDFMRFLLRWQHLTPGTALGGKAGVRSAIARLQGFEAPARAWEPSLLCARVPDYRSSWLDELCLAGEVAWVRLTPRRPAASGRTAATRATPMTLARRLELPSLLAAVRIGLAAADPGPEAGASGEVLALLRSRGALFFDEIVSTTRRLPGDVESALRELIAGGFVTSDGFQGLRDIVTGRKRGRSQAPRRIAYLPGGIFAGGGPAGRWAAVVAPVAGPGDVEELAERIAMTLLERYGVVFRDLVQGESFALPWRDLLRALRRFEARGTVRGGRFVSGFVGEQYALPEAVDSLRRVRRTARTGERVRVSAVDPMNLTGVILPGPRVPAQPDGSVEYVDGLPEGSVAPDGALFAKVG